VKLADCIRTSEIPNLAHRDWLEGSFQYPNCSCGTCSDLFKAAATTVSVKAAGCCKQVMSDSESPGSTPGTDYYGLILF
jgi:hypothetical protein